METETKTQEPSFSPNDLIDARYYLKMAIYKINFDSPTFEHLLSSILAEAAEVDQDELASQEEMYDG